MPFHRLLLPFSSGWAEEGTKDPVLAQFFLDMVVFRDKLMANCEHVKGDCRQTSAKKDEGLTT
jgi:hypothetical protein